MSRLYCVVSVFGLRALLLARITHLLAHDCKSIDGGVFGHKFGFGLWGKIQETWATIGMWMHYRNTVFIVLLRNWCSLKLARLLFLFFFIFIFICNRMLSFFVCVSLFHPWTLFQLFAFGINQIQSMAVITYLFADLLMRMTIAADSRLFN